MIFVEISVFLWENCVAIMFNPTLRGNLTYQFSFEESYAKQTTNFKCLMQFWIATTHASSEYLPITCFSAVFFCPFNFIGCNPDPTQVNAKAFTNFLWEKGLHLLSVSVVVGGMHLRHQKTSLQCFSVPSNSDFSPATFYCFWERKFLRNPKSKYETCSVFYTINSNFSYWSCVEELHI